MKRYIISSTNTCTYHIKFKLYDFPVTDECIITAPCGLDADGLYNYVYDYIFNKLEVVSASNDKEEYRLSREEVDYLDSAWGYKSGVPEEEYDEELAKEGYYDDYYEKPQYSGYMTELEWEIKFRYNDIEFTYTTTADTWRGESDVIENAKDCIADNQDITEVEILE